MKYPDDEQTQRLLKDLTGDYAPAKVIESAMVETQDPFSHRVRIAHLLSRFGQVEVKH